MSKSQHRSKIPSRSKLSLDTWAVIVALLAAAVVRLGLVRIPW